jgi:uncharacterized protein YhfF
LEKSVSLPLFELGFAGTPLRRALVAAALSGEKTATASLVSDYEPHTTDPLPVVGDRSTMLDVDDKPAAIVETTAVTIVPARDVELAFARDEGEGFESVAAWRAAHERFWHDQAITDQTLIVCQWFRVVERL